MAGLMCLFMSSVVDRPCLSLLEGDLVGVIKKKDPMGSQNRWLIDNGGKNSRGQIVVF